MTNKAKGVTIAALSDTHTGSTMGLMYPKSYQLADGDRNPNKAQEALFERFEQFAGTVAGKRKRNTLAVVICGDAIDGNHHGTHQLVTHKVSEQRELFADVLDYFLKKVSFDDAKGDRLYFVNGTELKGTHGSTQDTDAIARDFGAVPFRPPTDADAEDPDDPAHEKKRGGWYPWQFLELSVRGHLFQFAHHPPARVGNRAHTEGNAIAAWLRSMQTQRAARNLPIPRFTIWGHLHTALIVPRWFNNGTPNQPMTEAVSLPCFQLPTEYVEQVIPFRTPTSIGGFWATVSADGSQLDRAIEYTEVENRTEPIAI